MIDGDEAQTPEEVPFYRPPVPMLDENGQPVYPELRSNSSQDPAAWITQGAIADRTGEHLGRSDKGIIMFRQMLEDNIKIVEDGGEPMEVYRDPANNVYIPFMTEQHNYVDTSTRQGAATMYSPILDQRESPRLRPSRPTGTAAGRGETGARRHLPAIDHPGRWLVRGGSATDEPIRGWAVRPHPPSARRR